MLSREGQKWLVSVYVIGIEKDEVISSIFGILEFKKGIFLPLLSPNYPLYSLYRNSLSHNEPSIHF